MGSKWKLTPWLTAALMLAAAVGCVSEDEVEKKKVVLTWEMVARAIDQQLGEISDGDPQNCNGQGAALGPGAHCKDRLQGRVTQSTVVQYVELMLDTVLFNGDTAFYKRGFMPQTMDPCLEDGDTNGWADYSETCITGSVSCAVALDGHLQLVYNDCVWQEPGPDQWRLDGQMDIYQSLTSRAELLLIMRSKGFTGENLTGVNVPINATYDYSGTAVRYLRLNAFLGGPATGTTGLGSIDGMELVDINVTVDMDGDAGPSVANTYDLNIAQDYEDGLVFYTFPGPGVWLKDPDATTLVFYEKDLPWDNVGTGCWVDILDVDDVARTFIFTSQDAYLSNGCIPDLNPPGPVSY
ncbi:MAG TPA: hypothetical protein VM658_15505 [bacterium]|nr:hypothetical protein [bacterium]